MLPLLKEFAINIRDARLDGIKLLSPVLQGLVFLTLEFRNLAHEFARLLDLIVRQIDDIDDIFVLVDLDIDWHILHWIHPSACWLFAITWST